MKDRVDKILKQVEVDISKIDLYSYNIIETSLSMVHHLQGILTDLRNQLQTKGICSHIISVKNNYIIN